MILAKLPAELRGRVRATNPDRITLNVPLAVILPQLATGAVKMNFGDLRRSLPEDTFFTQSDRDQQAIELPLKEILSRLKPEHLPRRGRRVSDVSDEIVSPFAGNGEGLTFYKPEAGPLTPPAQRSVTPPEPAPAAEAEPSTRERRIQMPANGLASLSLPTPGPVATHSGLREQPSQASATSAILTAATQPHNPTGAKLKLPMADLSENWLPAVKCELSHFQLANAMLAVPLAAVEEGLKKGRMIFTWKQIRSWTDSPAAGLSSSAHDSELLELPLKVVAPAFMALSRNGRSAKRVSVDLNIPDTFSIAAPGGVAVAPAAPAPAAPAAPIPFTPAPVTSPGPAPVPAPAVPETPRIPFRAADSIVFPDEEAGKARLAHAQAQQAQQAQDPTVPRSGTEFLKRYATPNDIVGRAASYEGVAGAIVTLADGLLVASHLPPGVNGDQLAAFTPQVYGRVAQSTREFRMGELREFTFTVGTTAWAVFRVGAIYFAAYGTGHDPLPVAKLAVLAQELDRKPKAQTP